MRVDPHWRFDDIDLDIVHHTEDEDICVGATSNNGLFPRSSAIKEWLPMQQVRHIRELML